MASKTHREGRKASICLRDDVYHDFNSMNTTVWRRISAMCLLLHGKTVEAWLERIPRTLDGCFEVLHSLAVQYLD